MLTGDTKWSFTVHPRLARGLLLAWDMWWHIANLPSSSKDLNCASQAVLLNQKDFQLHQGQAVLAFGKKPKRLSVP